MSYNSYKISSRGSRGYSRGYSGGYRGSNRGGNDSSSWRGGGRGSYSGSPSRGRFSGRFEKDSSGYDSRSRYVGMSDGYTTHEDGSHRRYRDESVYSGRDRSHRASSPERKRMRTEYSHASSMHRSHEYGDDNDYSNRSYSGYSEMESKRVSRGYVGGDDRRGYRDDRERMRSDDYQYRKSSALASPRHSSRGVYRGRTYSRGRGVGRSSFKRNENYLGYLTKRRTLESYGLRKRGASSKTAEFLQRLKLYRLKSKLKKDKSDDEDDKENDEDDDGEEEEEEIEEEIEEEVEEEVTDNDEEGEGEQKEEDDEEQKKDGEEDLEEGEETNEESKKSPQKKKVKVVKKVVKVIKKVKKKKPATKRAATSGNEEDGEENKTEGGVQVTIKQDSESRAVNDETVRTNRAGQPYIKLECPHCHGVFVTFREYSNHLFTSKHVSTMTKLTLRLRQTLAKMRVEQRSEQIAIDEEAQTQKPNMRTLYCATCKLNYRSLKAEHIASEKHNAIREFLSPYCKVCRISFKTPMFYQHHLCQLDHIRRLDSREKRLGEKEEGKRVDIDQFMILDSVGSGEEESGEESGEEEEEQTEVKKEPMEGEEEKEETDKDAVKKKKKKKKAAIKLGLEHCKKVEVYFCDLCKFYLPRVGEEETILAQHCRSRNHLHRYVRYRDDQAMRKRIERLRQMREEAKKKEEEEKKEEEPMEVDASEKQDDEKTTDSAQKSTSEKKIKVEEPVLDEKMWSEVDKDLGELLREVEPGKSSDDEEDDSRAGDRRYDRFKLSQKEKHLLKKKVDDEDEEEEAKEGNSKKSEDEDSKPALVEVNGEDK